MASLRPSWDLFKAYVKDFKGFMKIVCRVIYFHECFLDLIDYE